jgi:FtsH-binding integral membrane protein
LAGLLPAIAALFTIIWTGIRIYETNTVQRWLGK